MNKIEILQNQITSDIASLRKDVRDGYYNNNLADWAKSFSKVLDKMIHVNEIVLGIESKFEPMSPKDLPNYYE